MTQSRGNLTAANIVNLATGMVVHCMFNPHEYTVAKQNQYQPGETIGRNVPKMTFRQGGAESLRLQLFFDTFAEKVDVRIHTEPLWSMMMVGPKDPRSNKAEPPKVAFHWGSFYFKAVITSISQKFTLFDKEGIPLRTTLDVNFQQVEDPYAIPFQNPTSGRGPALRTHIVQEGERLDLIAAKAYGDASHWRLIADENRVFHPMRLRPGQQLVLPPVE